MAWSLSESTTDLRAIAVLHAAALQMSPGLFIFCLSLFEWPMVPFSVSVYLLVRAYLSLRER